jgi:xanthosine utilization system XapX-like protein
VPAVAISPATIAAVNCVVLTNVVVLAAPLNFTTDVDTNPVPFTVSVNPAPPAVALVGEIDVSVGAGLLTVNVCAFDVPPPAGFVTVTFTVPAVTMSPAGTVATICVAVTDDGVIAGFPPKFTAAPLTKPVPVSVNVNAAPPTVPLAGAIEASVGAATGLIVKV